MSLVEVIIVSGVLILVAAGSQMVLGNLVGTQRHIEQKSSSYYLNNEIYSTLGNPASCTATFKDLTLRDLEALRGSEEYQAGREVPFHKIMGNDSPPTSQYETFSSSGKTYDNGSIGIESMKLYHYRPSALTGSERYNGRAKLMVQFLKVGGKSGPELRPKDFTLAFEFKRDRASGGLAEDNGQNQKLHSCSVLGATANAMLEIAVLRRTGVALSNLNCIAPATAEDYDGSTTCDDANNNKFCDSRTADGRLLVTVPHPFSDPSHERYTSRWLHSMVTVHPAILSGNVGRCPVRVVDKPPGAVAEDIFFLYDGENGSTSSGLGCKNENGWIMSSCMLTNWGTGGDSDTSLHKDARGTRCSTNDWSQPHMDTPWAIKNVTMTVICSRVLR